MCSLEITKFWTSTEGKNRDMIWGFLSLAQQEHANGQGGLGMTQVAS